MTKQTIMVTEDLYRITVTDQEYDRMMASVMALSEKKRAKWHDTLTDTCGTRTKCIYRDGEILNWSILGHTWAIVKPLRELQNANTVFIPLTSVGDAASQGNDEAVEDAMLNAMEANHTGNHYRNHTIKIAKQGDGCVRG